MCVCVYVNYYLLLHGFEFHCRFFALGVDSSLGFHSRFLAVKWSPSLLATCT